jgi:hypothetical protein
MEIRKKEHKKIILLGFITCEAFNCKALRTNIFEGGYHVMTQRGNIGLNVYDMTPRGGIGAKCTCKCKYICNKVDLVVKGPHVQL